MQVAMPIAPGHHRRPEKEGTMKRLMVCAVALSFALGACKKSKETAASDKSVEGNKPAATAPATTESKKAAADDHTGVQAGGIAHADNEGAAAVLASMNGTVEV